ncbi:CDP-glycerol glycerophosphotransferase family protein [Vibrio barjaei]|uniref:CDP-glycerol glycerophosphotransferase family protein n=1 Tax=Vibrio barjaei TaxID=1676683 RepID=UPI002284FF88|nr:CDP-glycerol glycerophosphotransferase family protein [Vibrio barjaei]MCY9872348.1 CDP-glycerol glycerophosphotransferase family protein [Vibrio barjaei]
MRIGFVAWNLFQVQHYLPFMSLFDDPVLVIENKGKEDYSSLLQIADEEGFSVLPLCAKNIESIDDLFDIVLCQTPFAKIERLRKVKIGMLQYGLAKEVHNHGPWRALADVIFTYGTYTKNHLETYAPCFSIGHPKFLRNGLKKNSVNSQRPKIVYAPTHGELTSAHYFLDSVVNLSKTYDVTIKLHHNLILNSTLDDELLELANPYLSTKNLEDLISESDIVISDFSGAIFDAIYLSKKVVLTRPNLDGKFVENKINNESLEVAKTPEIGPVVSNPDNLGNIIDNVFTNKIDFSERNMKLRKDLFTNEIKACSVPKIIEAVCSGELQKSQTQRFLKEAIKEARVNKFLLRRVGRK